MSEFFSLWAPQLTEAWGGTYLHVVIILLVFGLGIPSLVLQITVPEDIRRIYYKHTGIRRRISLLTLFLVLVSLAFIWVLHPCSGPLPAHKHIIAGLSLTAAIVFTFFYWWASLAELVRERLVQKLANRLRGSFRKKPTLDQNLLTDLIYLGEWAEPGHEKTIVLDALAKIAAVVQEDKRYSGRELEDLLRDLPEIILNKVKKGNGINFQQAASLLREVLARNIKAGRIQSNDVALAYQALARLGEAALKLGYAAAALHIVQLGGGDGPLLLKLGKAGIRSGQYLLSFAALSKLKAMRGLEETDTTGVHAYLLGLLAHFWMAGPTLRNHAASYFKTQGFNFKPNLQDNLEDAIRNLTDGMHIDTTDVIYGMLRDLEFKGYL